MLPRPYLLLDKDYAFTLERDGDGWRLFFSGIKFEGVCSSWDAAETLMRTWRGGEDFGLEDEQIMELINRIGG